eukprot:569966-Pyramimonas_sp.AAC.1
MKERSCGEVRGHGSDRGGRTRQSKPGMVRMQRKGGRPDGWATKSRDAGGRKARKGHCAFTGGKRTRVRLQRSSAGGPSIAT